MPTPDVLDFAKLLAPIPGDKPTGVDLRANAGPSSLYYQVKDSRNAARAAERIMEGGAEDPQPPDWRIVVSHATKALATASKDLEIAAYLIEALCRTHGAAGLRDGFKLTKGFVELFWDDLYPTPDEEGITTRVAPLTGLNGDDSEGTLIAPINRIPLTEGGGGERFTYSNYMQAANLNKTLDPKVKEQKIAAGAMNTELFQKIVDETPNQFYRTLFEDLTLAIDEFAKMNAALDAKAGPAAPPTSTIRASLTNLLDAIKDVAKSKLAMTMAAPAAENAPEGDGAGAAAGNGKPGGKQEGGEALPVIRGRDDALNAILQIGNYFRRVEPSSLVPFALDQAVRWARMPLPDLLSELIPDEGPRKALFKQIGIRAGEAAEGEGKKKK